MIPGVARPGCVRRMLNVYGGRSVGTVFALVSPRVSLLTSGGGGFRRVNILPLYPSGRATSLYFSGCDVCLCLGGRNIGAPLAFRRLSSFGTTCFGNRVRFPIFVGPHANDNDIKTRGIGAVRSLRGCCTRGTFSCVVRRFVRNSYSTSTCVSCCSGRIISVFSGGGVRAHVNKTDGAVSFGSRHLFSFIRSFVRLFSFTKTVSVSFFFESKRCCLSRVGPHFNKTCLRTCNTKISFFGLVVGGVGNIAGRIHVNSCSRNILVLVCSSMIVAGRISLLESCRSWSHLRGDQDQDRSR